MTSTATRQSTGESGTSSSRSRMPRWFSLRQVFQDIQRQRFMVTGSAPSLSSGRASTSKRRSNNASSGGPIEVEGSKSGKRQAPSRHGSGSSSRRQQDVEAGLSTASILPRTSVASSVSRMTSTSGDDLECPLCTVVQPRTAFLHVRTCDHVACATCMRAYLKVEITESRANVACPACSERLHPNDIEAILTSGAGDGNGFDKTEASILMSKYEEFMLRRVLVLDPDARWCPAPDCGYAVIATGCASCPQLTCHRPGCGMLFCYHCKQQWHPNQTCDTARAERTLNLRSSSFSYSQESNTHSEIKPCPRCGAFIVKMDDGSCNHMTCAVCGAEFCWLCMMEISDLHYLSPSGCTFWGKKPWSRKKKILWQLGTLIGAPVGITLIAGIAVPAIILGVPIWVGKKLHTKCNNMPKHKRNMAVAGGVIGSILVSPVLAALAVGVGVPILLAYVYGVVPISLCRNGGCGVTTTNNGGVRIDFDENETAAAGPNVYALDARSVVETVDGHHIINPSIGPSIGEMSVGLTNSLSASGSHLERVGGVIREDSCDCDSASRHAIGGSCAEPERLAGVGSSISTSPPNRLEVQAEVSSNVAELTKRASLSSESANFSLDAKSCTVSFGDNISTNALAGSLCTRDRDSNSAVISLSDVPHVIPEPVVTSALSHCPPSASLSSDHVGGGDACVSPSSRASSNDSAFLPRAAVAAAQFSSPATAPRSVSFVRDIKDTPSKTVPRGDTSGLASSAGRAAGVKSAYKRQSMSVGDSIDEERPEPAATFDYLSVQSLTAEDQAGVLECCTGGSDIVAMVAAAAGAGDGAATGRVYGRLRNSAGEMGAPRRISMSSSTSAMKTHATLVPSDSAGCVQSSIALTCDEERGESSFITRPAASQPSLSIYHQQSTVCELHNERSFAFNQQTVRSLLIEIQNVVKIIDIQKFTNKFSENIMLGLYSPIVSKKASGKGPAD